MLAGVYGVDEQMTIKDGIRLGIGILIANIAFNTLLGLAQMAWLYLVLR